MKASVVKLVTGDSSNLLASKTPVFGQTIDATESYPVGELFSFNQSQGDIGLLKGPLWLRSDILARIWLLFSHRLWRLK